MVWGASHSHNCVGGYLESARLAKNFQKWRFISQITYISFGNVLTHSMEQNPSWEANRFSANLEIPRILCNPKVHYRIHKCPPPVPVLSQIRLSCHLSLGLSIGLFPSVFPNKTLYETLLSAIRAACPAHLILDLITWTILGEESRSLSSSLCSFLHSPVTSSLLGPNILLSTIFSNTLSPRSSLSVSD